MQGLNVPVTHLWHWFNSCDPANNLCSDRYNPSQGHFEVIQIAWGLEIITMARPAEGSTLPCECAAALYEGYLKGRAQSKTLPTNSNILLVALLRVPVNVKSLHPSGTGR
jgi:hypothetical protein